MHQHKFLLFVFSAVLAFGWAEVAMANADTTCFVCQENGSCTGGTWSDMGDGTRIYNGFTGGVLVEQASRDLHDCVNAGGIGIVDRNNDGSLEAMDFRSGRQSRSDLDPGSVRAGSQCGATRRQPCTRVDTGFPSLISPPSPMPTPAPVSCTESTDTGEFGECEGEWGPWENGIRSFEGSRCRTITTINSCGGSDSAQECVPCGEDEIDNESPACDSVVAWSERPLRSSVSHCEDALSGCDESSYENGIINLEGRISPARACDEAGNCVDCPVTNSDDIAPGCVASFQHPGRWHRSEEFESNGGNLKCWLESCEDEGDSGCLPIPTGADTPTVYQDETYGNIEIEQDPLDPVHRDTCTIQVCDNAGNCSTCESPEVAYDGTNVCRSAIGFCGECDEDDHDCRCISGERDQCTDSGPINCYADPFNDRCPGFDNPACLDNNFVPGCPVFNPCYPERNRDHPRAGAVDCPEDSIRFCSRNPYHYGCNEACKFGLIECDPDVPDS